MNISSSTNYLYESSIYAESFICANCGIEHKPLKSHYIFTHFTHKFCSYNCKMKYLKSLPKVNEKNKSSF